MNFFLLHLPIFLSVVPWDSSGIWLPIGHVMVRVLMVYYTEEISGTLDNIYLLQCHPEVSISHYVIIYFISKYIFISCIFCFSAIFPSMTLVPYVFFWLGHISKLNMWDNLSRSLSRSCWAFLSRANPLNAMLSLWMPCYPFECHANPLNAMLSLWMPCYPFECHAIPLNAMLTLWMPCYPFECHANPLNAMLTLWMPC